MILDLQLWGDHKSKITTQRRADGAGRPTAGAPARSVSTAEPPTCPTRTRLYRSGRLLAEGFAAEDIRSRLDAQADAVVWLDLYEPTEADLQIVVEEFGLHALAVEDAIQAHQRAKVDRYRSHLFANMYVVGVDEQGEAPTALTTGEISVFATSRALITVRKHEFDIDALISKWDLNTELVSPTNAVSFLLYGLLDAGLSAPGRRGSPRSTTQRRAASTGRANDPTSQSLALVSS